MIDHAASLYTDADITMDGDHAQCGDHFGIGKVQRIDPRLYWNLKNINGNFLAAEYRRLRMTNHEIDKFFDRVAGINRHALPACAGC